MKLHRIVLALLLASVVSAGCEEWRHTGPQYPAKNSSEKTNLSQSHWQSDGFSPTTQPSR